MFSSERTIFELTSTVSAAHSRSGGGVCEDPVPGGAAADNSGAHVGFLCGSRADRECG